MLISPFFIMPTVNALIWKNMFMNPVYGLFAFVSGVFGWPVVDWLSDSSTFVDYYYAELAMDSICFTYFYDFTSIYG